jgi:Zn finger protein HypA/HybF involved in hydrogenase expression
MSEYHSRVDQILHKTANLDDEYVLEGRYIRYGKLQKDFRAIVTELESQLTSQEKTIERLEEQLEQMKASNLKRIIEHDDTKKRMYEQLEVAIEVLEKERLINCDCGMHIISGEEVKYQCWSCEALAKIEAMREEK